MSDFDFAAARKQTLADIARELQERRGEPVAAASTLLRRPAAELAELIEQLCGDEYAIDAEGHVQPVPEEYGGPMEPAEDDGPVVGMFEPAEADDTEPAPAQPAGPDPQPAGTGQQAPAGPGPGR